MTNTIEIARQYALAVIPDLSVALMPGDNPADVAQSLLDQFEPPDEVSAQSALSAMVSRLEEASL